MSPWILRKQRVPGTLGAEALSDRGQKHCMTLDATLKPNGQLGRGRLNATPWTFPPAALQSLDEAGRGPSTGVTAIQVDPSGSRGLRMEGTGHIQEWPKEWHRQDCSEVAWVREGVTWDRDRQRHRNERRRRRPRGGCDGLREEEIPDCPAVRPCCHLCWSPTAVTALYQQCQA